MNPGRPLDALYSPEACKDPAEQEDPISLDKRRQEGKEAIGGHADE